MIIALIKIDSYNYPVKPPDEIPWPVGIQIGEDFGSKISMTSLTLSNNIVVGDKLRLSILETDKILLWSRESTA